MMVRMRWYCRRWRNGLLALEACKVVGRPGDYKPLILDSRSRLYLYRYWDYERTLADFIKGRIGIAER